MNYKFEKAEKSTVKVFITLDANEWDAAQTEAYNRTKGKYSVPGFRKGHVPRKVLESAYGKGLFFEDAINGAFPKYYYEVLGKEPSIEAVAQPSLDVEDVSDKGITFVAVVPVKPEVKLGEYKGIKFKKVEYNVKDEDVENEVERLLKQHATDVEVTDRAAKDGDETVIDYSGAIDGKKFDGGTAENQNLTLGSGMFIPGFEEQVVGMKIGETKDINVKFPEDYGAAELKGKDAVFTVTLHAIKEKKLPELTDEFVKEKTGSETVEAYKASVRERLEKNNAQRAERETEDKLVKAISDTTEVEIPDALIEKQIDNMVQEMSYRMMYQGLKLEDYLKYTNQTMEAYRETFREKAKDQVKTQLIIDKIITDEKLEATEEEIDAKIAEQAANAKEDPEKYKKSVNDRQKSYIENGIVIDKLFKFLKENNEIA